MPYEGEESSFLIVLPNKVDGLSQLQEKLKDASALGKAIAAMSSYNVEVVLPKFKIETETDLKVILQKVILFFIDVVLIKGCTVIRNIVKYTYIYFTENHKLNLMWNNIKTYNRMCNMYYL